MRKKYKTLIRLPAILLLLVVAACAAAPVPPPQNAGNRYELTITQIGTRSITYEGRLYVDGREIIGRNIGETYKIHGYTFEWFGKNKRLYQKGWRMSD